MQSWNRQSSHSHEDIFSRMEKSDMFWKYYDFSFVLLYPSQNMWGLDPSHLMIIYEFFDVKQLAIIGGLRSIARFWDKSSSGDFVKKSF